MSSGDAVNVLSAVSASATLDIKPSSGGEWIIHNILIPDGLATGVELYAVGSEGTILLGTLKQPLFLCNFHVTNTYYLRVKNLEAASENLGADGIVMK
jgi:hypothetical protein